MTAIISPLSLFTVKGHTTCPALLALGCLAALGVNLWFAGCGAAPRVGVQHELQRLLDRDPRFLPVSVPSDRGLTGGVFITANAVKPETTCSRPGAAVPGGRGGVTLWRCVLRVHPTDPSVMRYLARSTVAYRFHVTPRGDWETVGSRGERLHGCCLRTGGSR